MNAEIFTECYIQCPQKIAHAEFNLKDYQTPHERYLHLLKKVQNFIKAIALQRIEKLKAYLVNCKIKCRILDKKNHEAISKMNCSFAVLNPSIFLG